ncbi:MAG: hypothetical protein D6737_15510 [Chloroflexi bacterium]|nr:MAG: hypothetical protein D6737_15510 [Chloroflexota bacterium]
MATASAARAKAPAKKKDAVQVAAPSRREFLFYIWGASMALLAGETVAGLFFFLLPRFRAGTFGGVFTVSGEDVPPIGADPVNEPAGRFWMSNTEQGYLSLFQVCTHLGCLPKWVPTNNRFECPCHGSKFEATGKYIEGPAPRSLDRFPTTIIFEDGTTVTTNSAGDPVPLNGKRILKIEVDTGNRIRRPGREL